MSLTAKLETFVDVEKHRGSTTNLQTFVDIEKHEGISTKIETWADMPLRNDITLNLQTWVYTQEPKVQGIEVDVFGDTERVHSGAIDAHGDLYREISNTLIQTIEFKNDMCLNIIRDQWVYGDLNRGILGPVDLYADTDIIIGAITIDVYGDTDRYPAQAMDVYGDMRIRIPLNLDRYETIRRRKTSTIAPGYGFNNNSLGNALITHTNDDAEYIEETKHYLQGVSNISLSLQTQTMADSFTLQGINKIYPKNLINGTLLDFPFQFQAEETTEQGITFAVNKSSYNSDAMLYQMLSYEFWVDTPKKTYKNRTTNKTENDYAISEHFNAIVRGLHLTPAIMIRNNFVPDVSLEKTQTTYQSFLSSMIGWSDEVPRIKFMAFIRNINTVYLFQRGCETGNINLDEKKWYNYPSYKRRTLRTMWWNPDEVEDETPTAIAVKGITAIHHINPPWENEDENPYSPENVDPDTEAQFEAVGRGDGKVDNRIKYVRRLNEDGSITETNYEYFETSTNYLLAKVTEITKGPAWVDPETGIEVPGYIDTKITKYSYKNGWRHKEVWHNNVKVEESEDASPDQGGKSEPTQETNDNSSNADKPRPGLEGNEFTDEQETLAMGGKWVTKGKDSQAYITDNDAPVKDSDTAALYYSELQWMNGAVEEIVDITITAPVTNGVVDPEDNHVCDFFTTYTLNGNTYYLNSNNVTMSTRELTQKLQLIRWYK